MSSAISEFQSKAEMLPASLAFSTERLCALVDKTEAHGEIFAAQRLKRALSILKRETGQPIEHTPAKIKELGVFRQRQFIEQTTNAALCEDILELYEELHAALIEHGFYASEVKGKLLDACIALDPLNPSHHYKAGRMLATEAFEFIALNTASRTIDHNGFSLNQFAKAEKHFQQALLLSADLAHEDINNKAYDALEKISPYTRVKRPTEKTKLRLVSETLDI